MTEIEVKQSFTVLYVNVNSLLLYRCSRPIDCMSLQCPFIMFYTDSENRTRNHKAMVPQFCGLFL